MAHNVMVKYVGPKKHITVPFPEDNQFPLCSASDPHDVIVFPRNQMVELSPERAEALLKQSPAVFKAVMTIKPAAKTIKSGAPKSAPVVTEMTEEEFNRAEGDSHTVLENTELADDHEGH